MIEAIANCTDRTVKVSGPVSSGKTEALVRRCAAILAAEEEARVLVVCATSFAAQAFRDRLRTLVGTQVEEWEKRVIAETALETCLNTLEKDEVKAITGRTGRLITDFEYNFILEDMKTYGQSRRELRKMLKRFYTSWADYADEKSWYFGDGKIVCDYLRRFCTHLGGVSKFEAPYLCAAALQTDEGRSLCGSYDYVLCDDFPNLTHSEQMVVCLHAKKQLVVTGNVNEQGSAASAYAHPAGFSKFEALRRDVTTFALSTAYGNAQIQRTANALVAEEPAEGAQDDPASCGEKPAMDPSFRATGFQEEGDPVLLLKWNTPKDELVGLTKILRSESDDDRRIQERNTCVVVPNKRWGRMYERALIQRGFKVSTAGVSTGIGGDPRDASTCPALVAYVKLNLIACPEDAMAWRAWCGLNDYLTNSQSWRGLYEMADQQGGVLACLQKLGKAYEAGEPEPFLRSHVLAERYLAGAEIVAKNTGRRGFNLLNAIGASRLPEFKDVEESMAGEESAAELFDLIRTQVISPVFPEGSHILRISTYANMTGTRYQTVIAPSLVDGYVPNRNAFEVVSTDRERKRELDAERRMFYATIGKASQRLILSYFSKCDLELAERTKMQVARIRSENGQRSALARSSRFLSELGEAAPGSVSGQAFLSERGLN